MRRPPKDCPLCGWRWALSLEGCHAGIESDRAFPTRREAREDAEPRRRAADADLAERTDRAGFTHALDLFPHYCESHAL